jgi:putative nucleotidyltransferase with HDIG domain
MDIMTKTHDETPELRVLIIEDSENDADLIARALKKSNGFDLKTERVDNSNDLFRALTDDEWDLIICDVNIPGLSFKSTLAMIERFDTDTPVIIVTGSISSLDLIEMIGYTTSYGYVNKSELWLIGSVVKNIRQIDTEQYQQLELLTRALEYKDHNTKEHSDRVVGLSVAVAREMGLSGKSIKYIKRGALLHDIGKVGIPDSILLKKSALTPEEMDIMKLHPQLGYELLKSSPSMKRVVDIPHYHHERWDGSGYPHGLKGTAIPLAARIFSVVDVYDAMANSRVYREALPKEDVIEYIKTESGKYFDPDVVKAFLNVIEEEE